MVLPPTLACLLLVLSSISTVGGDDDTTITVHPHAANCSSPQAGEGGGGGGENVTMNLDDALKAVSAGASNVLLQLLTGYHCIQDYHLLQGATNLTLAGLGSCENVVIRCGEGRGLLFFNATNLTIRNLTVDGCGLTGSNLTEFHDQLNTFIDFFYKIPTWYHIALLCGLCSDFHLADTVIKNTKGLGFLGVNVVGNSSSLNANFSANAPPGFCFHDPPINISHVDHAGGGALFIYHDYLSSNHSTPSLLAVRDSFFYNNSYCGLESIYELYYETSRTARDVGFVLGAGGGLSVIMTQVTYTVNVSVFNSMFKKNTARYGAGAFIATFSGTCGCHSWFHECVFQQNGLEDDVSPDDDILVNSGSGVVFFKDITHPDTLSHPFSFPLSNKSNSLLITRSNFTGNKASTAAVLLIVSQYMSANAYLGDFVRVDGCTFENNSASIVGLIQAFERKHSGEQPGLQIQLNDIMVRNNTIYAPSGRELKPPAQTASMLSFSAVKAIMSGNCTFLHNIGTVVLAVNSILHFYGNTNFTHNMGVFGGAVRILGSSSIVVHNDSYLLFRQNAAAVQGGAIYADFSGSIASFIYYDCILYFDEIDLFCFGPGSCPDVRKSTAKIEFLNNTAKSGGVMFGSTLDTCPWGMKLKQDLNMPRGTLLFDVLYNNLSSVFNFNGVPPTTTDVVSTPTKSITVHSSPSKPVKPGQRFYVNITGVDHFSRAIPLVLTSLSTLTDTGYTVSKLGASGYWFTDQDPLTPISVRGDLHQQNISVDLYVTDSLAQTNFHIHLGNCSPGFKYDNTTLVCQCDSVWHQMNVDCSELTQTLIVPSDRWLGVDAHGELVFGDCIFDYCKLGDRNVTPPDFDSQCHTDYSRTGLLCGECKENYSIGFATNRCLKCTNNFGLWWILFFAMAGIFVVFGITFLRITIADGYLNGVLLYCNVVSLYQTALISDTPLSKYLLWVSFLNLNLGIESCFYQGMGQLARVGLEFVFPLYLYLLMISITVLARCSQRVSQLFTGSGFSASKLFATLMIMTYTSVFETCAKILAAVDVRTLSGDYSVRWRLDPNRGYFSGFHAFLGVFSILVIGLYIIPFPLLLIFQNIAFKFKWVQRLKPIYDVFGAPFKPQFRFWIGLRLLLRFVPLAFISALYSPLNVFLLGVATLVLLLVQIIVSPFKGRLRNAFDNFFLCNIVLLSLIILYFTIYLYEGTNGYIEHYRQLQHIFVCLVVSLSYIAFFLFFMWHLILRFPSLKLLPRRILTKLKECVLGYKTSSSVSKSTTTYGSMNTGSDDCDDVDKDFEVVSISEVGHGMFHQVTTVKFSELREPLLDEGSVSLVPVDRSNSIQ